MADTEYHGLITFMNAHTSKCATELKNNINKYWKNGKFSDEMPESPHTRNMYKEYKIGVFLYIADAISEGKYFVNIRHTNEFRDIAVSHTYAITDDLKSLGYKVYVSRDLMNLKVVWGEDKIVSENIPISQNNDSIAQSVKKRRRII